MSYDLHFKPRNGALDEDQFFQYFETRPNYTRDGLQVWYKNSETGVYFAFELLPQLEVKSGEAREYYPVKVNIHYFRPSFFIVEAEPEVAQFVQAFDMLVADPELHGKGAEEYDAQKFTSGWSTGNESGYSEILSDRSMLGEFSHMPTESLERAWQWNFTRPRLQAQVGESKYVSAVVFVKVGDETATAAMWPDGIAAVIPPVEYICVVRKKFAPFSLFGKREDTALVPWSDAQQILQLHGSKASDGTIALNYADTPMAVEKFVRKLPRETRKVESLDMDRVLNREIFERYAAATANA